MIASIDNPESKSCLLPAIRERCGRVYELAKEGKPHYGYYHPEEEADVAAFCVEIMKVYPILASKPTSFPCPMNFQSGITGQVSRLCVSNLQFIHCNIVIEPTPQIRPHGRWRHLDTGVDRVLPLIAKFHADPNPPDLKEELRRTIDLFVVSVLLDAGAGNTWVFHEQSSGMKFSRSEGLGVASIHMFEEGFFSSDPLQPYRVDGACEVAYSTPC